MRSLLALTHRGVVTTHTFEGPRTTTMVPAHET